jgi:hypothetical protein
LHLLNKDLIAIGVFLDLGDHDLIEEVNLPKLLIVAILFVVFGVD